MTEQFKEGDVVQLKSGGPAMTILCLENCAKRGRVASCCWFLNEGKPEYMTIQIIALSIIPQ